MNSPFRMIRFILLLLAFCPYLAVSQKVQHESTPGWIQPVSYSTESTDTFNTGGYHYLLLERQFNLPTREYYNRTSVKVLTEKGLEDVSSISVNFDPSYERLVFHTVSIKRGDQILNKLKTNQFEILRREKNMDRLIYDKSLDAILNLDDVQVGDIVEYSYSLRGSNPVFNNLFFRTLYFNYSVPIGKTYTRIRCPKERTLQIKTFNNAAEPSKTEDANTIFYTWESENVPAVLTDDNVPSWHEANSNVEISEFESWKKLVQWGLPLYNTARVSSRAIDEKIEILQKKHQNADSLINATIEFVQDEIRYLSFSDGIQGYKPHSPAQVFTQRFGDCKDKSLLLSYMLQKMGIQCYPALVSTLYGKVLDASLPSPGLFDHCIAQIVHKDSVFWIDATATLQRGDLKSKSVIPYGQALVISETTTALTPIVFDPGPSSIKIEEDYTFKMVGGSTTLLVKTIFSGDEANSIRNYWKSNSAEEIKKSYTNFYSSDFSDISATKYVEFKDDKEQNIITTFEEYTIEDLWEYDSAKRLNTADFYARYLANYLESPNTKIRSMPYRVNYPKDISQTIIIHLPERWTVEESKSSISSAAFQFRSEIDYVDDQVKLYYAYKTLQDHVEAKNIKDYISKIQKTQGGLYFQLTHGGNTTTSTEPSFNTPYLFIALLMAPLLFVGFQQVYRFDPRARDYENGYDQIGGWILVPAIGVFLAPVMNIFRLVNSGYFDYIHWRTLADPTYAAYNQSLGIFNLVGYVYSLCLLAFSILLLILLVKKRTSFPLLICLVYVINMVYFVGEALWLKSLNIQTESKTSSGAPFIVVIVFSVIWIPLFIYSDRAKGTFRERLK